MGATKGQVRGWTLEAQGDGRVLMFGNGLVSIVAGKTELAVAIATPTRDRAIAQDGAHVLRSGLHLRNARAQTNHMTRSKGTVTCSVISLAVLGKVEFFALAVSSLSAKITPPALGTPVIS